MRNRSLPAAGAALILTLAGFGLAGPAAAGTGGANATGPYTSCEALLGTAEYPVDDFTCPPAGDSANGQGNAPHLAGSKGKADAKNPPGQVKKFASDPDYGYECDLNRGVGVGNPAHSGCVTPVPVEPDDDDEVIAE